MSAVLKSVPPVATQSGTGRLDIDQVSIHLGEGAQRFVALDEVTLTIEPGEFVCLLGPSGCGKSTLLGALAGHLQPTHGEARLDGLRIAGPDPQRGLVFQHHTLFPWLSVQDNVAYGLKMRGVSRSERLNLAQALLEEVGLQGFERRYPHALSGGMQQRVEIARVLINQPRVLLMDEPFGALDALTRLKMQELLLSLWGHLKTTIVFVTHDIDEALFMADRILVMSPRPGRIVEEIHVEAERPRQSEWLTSTPFAHLKRHCLDLLREPDTTLPLERLNPVTGLNRRGIRSSEF
ncbi:sulfonate ABC transporter ATP-binding protein (plasmid) [Aquabacterium olei]|uniref:Sulfonate ABC transporter ATP-binding protein n=1 Tax=Aquabacterium olei TaxID=1296669 RepID=A0A2U8FXI7_9BURK|nr:ABC transporter ATP-binding protein [Aquabacterium olei]AWI55607.1 sulfonate ABC transporter ATP-binding protein [Aquabacterium olei]